MDSHYDLQGARNALEQIACSAPEGEDRRLASMVLNTPGQGDHARVVRFEHPQTWRLIKGTSAVENKGPENEELVFTFMGIISQVDFPPIKEKPCVAHRRYKFLRQSASLTGLGSPTFDAALEATHRIFDTFQRQFQKGALDPWQTDVWQTPSHQSHPSLLVSNRYLTPRRDAPRMEHIPFESEVDPHGYLEAMFKDGYVHGEENIVEYYTKSTSTKDGKQIFAKGGPQRFREGDIVEVQVSFVVVPLKEQKYKMLGILHAIALLDTSFSQEATRKRSITASALRTTPVVSLKRKVGYETEQQPKKANMEVDG
ncbi:hypothetical protein BD779DRAFT_1678634 [Infundibulicybe gibba]|nr:hypothetical protein BD779DRAFT_1678634 [Infundibulicybe gibba]